MMNDIQNINCIIDSELNKSMALQSIIFKSELSKYLSPYADITNTPTDCIGLSPPQFKPQIKFVPYGTGTGKTYGAMNHYLILQTMAYEDVSENELVHRNNSQSCFTNAVFVTPNKNQINFDPNLVKKMLIAGITPLSVLGLADAYTKETTLWVDGKHNIYTRIKDYFDVIRDLENKYVHHEHESWVKGHLKAICSLIKDIKYCLENIEKLDTDLATGKTDKTQHDIDKTKVTERHRKSVNTLVLTVLNNVFDKRRFQKAGLLSGETGDEFTAVDDHENDYKDEFESTENTQKPNSNMDSGMHPIGENKVFETIFSKAKPKAHYDDLLSVTLSANDSFDCKLATLKKDILRVYAPMNYALYLPSFICMTSDKFRTQPTLYRISSKRDDNHWVADYDAADFQELIGNKFTYRGSLLSIPNTPNKDLRAKHLRETIFKIRSEYTPNKSGKSTSDKRSLFAKNDINFYVIIDEANLMYKKAFAGSETKDGVVKKVLDDFSVTDVLSSVERKYREFRFQDAANIDCYNQTKYFFEAMRTYLKVYCEIDEHKVFDAYLLQFEFPPNILYIDNAEADSITNIIKNAFSVNAKTFIDKGKLESIYVCRRGLQRYLSATQSSKDDITLYELYQIVMAILFAAIQFETVVNKFKANEKEAFRLELGGTDNSVTRQNTPLAALLKYVKRNSARYKEWLTDDHLNNASELLVDEWFAYIQTKLLFSLNLNKDFDASPDIGHQRKTFIDIKIHLITHHPEVDLLRMTVGTTNYIHIMSATSGKDGVYGGQYNIGFTKRWGKLFDVNVTTPEYDNHHHIDYRKIFSDFRNHRGQMRNVDVKTYNHMSDLFELLPVAAPKPAGNIQLGRQVKTPQNQTIRGYQSLATYLKANNAAKDKKNHVYIQPGSYNADAFGRAVAGMLIGLLNADTSLVLSMRADLFKFIRHSFAVEFDSDHPNMQKLKEAISHKRTEVVFTHTIFGKFQLPLLNEHLTNTAYQSGESKDAFWKVKKQILDKFIYMADLQNFASQFGLPCHSVMRLALYDSTIDKIHSGYKDHFQVKNIVIDGVARPLFTTIVSYNKAAALGLNNVIDNKILGLTEDVNRLFLASLEYWTGINEKSESGDQDGLNGYNKISNSLIYMRYLADPRNRRAVMIKEFDSNIGSDEALTLLAFEHNVEKNDTFRQTLGRTEREDSRIDFKSEIILPTADLEEQTKTSYQIYEMDENFTPNYNQLDYAFMSLNNHAVFMEGLKAIQARITTEELRGQLKKDTERSAKKLFQYCNGSEGFMRKILQVARQGDLSESHQALADAAIEFDRRYREPSILWCPKKWAECLNQSQIIAEGLANSRLGWGDVSEYFKLMTVNLTHYDAGRDLEVYQTAKGGLTDFVGTHVGGNRPYFPPNFVLKHIAHRLDENHCDKRFNELVAINNALVDPNAKDNHYYTTISNSYNPKIILHPSMMHMALGNIGEFLFKKFLDIYPGEYREYPQNEIACDFGYRFYEAFDVWLKTKKGHWVCVDVKNISHRDNKQSTQKLLDSETRKVTQAYEHSEAIEYAKTFEPTKTATNIDMGAESLFDCHDIARRVREMNMTSFFKDSDEMHIIFLNVRAGEHSITRPRQHKVDLNGRMVTVHVHYLTLFQSVRYLDEGKRKLIIRKNRDEEVAPTPAKRQWRLTVNSKLLDLLDVPPAVDMGNVFQTPSNETQDNNYEFGDQEEEIIRSIKESSNHNYEGE